MIEWTKLSISAFAATLREQANQVEFSALDVNEKIRRLKQCDKGGDPLSTFASMVVSNPDLLPYLLDIIAKFHSETIKEIVAGVVVKGANPLMVACCHRKESVPILLTFIEQYSSENLGTILSKLDQYGRNAIMMACIFQPENVPALLKMVQTLPIQQQEKILRQVNQWGNNTLALMPKKDAKAVDIAILGELDELLERLKPANKEKYVLDAGHPQVQLYNTLRESMDKYKASPNNLADLKGFHTAWNSAINKAFSSKAQWLDERATVARVLTSMLLILSVIGIVYLSYQAGKNQVRQRATFFPGANEEKLYAIQDNLARLSRAPELLKGEDYGADKYMGPTAPPSSHV